MLTCGKPYDDLFYHRPTDGHSGDTHLKMGILVIYLTMDILLTKLMM